MSADRLNEATGVSGHSVTEKTEMAASIRIMRKGRGQPLRDSEKAFFEPRFGYDFSKVRIHSESEAAHAAQFIHAKAFTVGRDIVFGANTFHPESKEGKRLLAHELAHVVQQNQSTSAHNQIQRQAAPVPQPANQGQPQNPALVEWNAHPNIHIHFANGFQTYSQLRPLYQARGIQNPAQYLDNNIVQVTFFGRSTPANTAISASLQAAEQSLQNQGIVPAINSFWAFVPRLAAAGQLSNHALGRAFDINPGANPHIRNNHDIRVIEAVTGVNLGQIQTAAAIRQASQTFQNSFNQQWINQQNQQLQNLTSQQNPNVQAQQQIQQLQQLIQSINSRRPILNGYAQSGFLNLELALINALTNAGFAWGGQWQHEKDFMHFEM